MVALHLRDLVLEPLVYHSQSLHVLNALLSVLLKGSKLAFQMCDLIFHFSLLLLITEEVMHLGSHSTQLLWINPS